MPRLQCQPMRFTHSLHIPRYVLAILLLSLACSSTTLSVWVLGRNPQLPTDPFAPFTDVFPGQPKSAVEAHGFSCLASAYADYFGSSDEAVTEICSLSLADGRFSRISVGVKADIVQNILFTMRDNSLMIGDLMLLWGQQDFHNYNSTKIFFWESSRITVTAANNTGHFSPFLPVQKVFIPNAE